MSEEFKEPTEEQEPTPGELNKSIFVRRTNGEITVMRMAEDGEKDEHGRSFAYIIEADEDDGIEYIAGRKPVSGLTLTEGVQAGLQAEYALAHPLETAEQSGAESVDFNRLAAERAQQFVSVDAGESNKDRIVGVSVDKLTVEQSAEAKEALREEAVEDLGEIAAEQVVTVEASKDNEPTLDQVLAEAKGQYDRTTEMLVDDASQGVNRMLGAIEDQVQQVDGDIKHLNYLRTETDVLRKVIFNIDASNYNNDMVRTSLNNMMSGLHSIYGRVRRASEQGVGEIAQPASRLETALEQAQNDVGVSDEAFMFAIAQQKQQYPDQQPSSTPEVTTTDFLSKVDTAKEMVAVLVAVPGSIQQNLGERVSRLRGQLNLLDQIAQSPDIRSEDLRRVVGMFDQITEGSDELLIGRKLQDTIDTLRGLFKAA